ncbi:MAG: hypothetical protein SGJ05_12345 [bacterium]|nr:hypothetical protein [bacterium]
MTQRELNNLNPLDLVKSFTSDGKPIYAHKWDAIEPKDLIQVRIETGAFMYLHREEFAEMLKAVASDDTTIPTYVLRDGIIYHNGERLTS